MLRASLALLAAALAALPARAANICGQNATLGAHVVAALNLTYPGLEAVAAAVAQGDLDAACEALAQYYRTSNTSAWLRIPPVAPGTGRVGAGSLVDNVVDHDLYYNSIKRHIDNDAVEPRAVVHGRERARGRVAALQHEAVRAPAQVEADKLVR
jgi:hypothetical protein